MAQPRAIIPEYGVRPALNETGAIIAIALCVIWDTTFEQVTLPGGNAAAVAGVTMEAMADSDDIRRNIQTEGLAKITASAAIAVGALVMPDTAGKVLTRTGTNSIVGTAKTAAAATGDVIEVELLRQVGA